MYYLNLAKNEILRYLGYKGQNLDIQTKMLIDECIDEIKSIAEERYIYKTFSIIRKNGGLSLENSSVNLEGSDIYNHLTDSDQCMLMAATLGCRVDSKIRYYEKINMTRALILNACANTAVEELCDNICRKIEGELEKEGKRLTSRYSPGYGDLPVEMQKNFISALGADKAIGLTASSNNILIPLKSVTAVVGIIQKGKSKQKKDCTKCSRYLTCQFRRESSCSEF